MTLFLLSLSIFFQVLATILALRLIPLSRGRFAWILIAAAFTVRGFRLIVEFYLVVFQDLQTNLIDEIFALTVSSLSATGVFCIAPIFRAFRKAEEDRENLLREIEHRAGELDATIHSIADALVIYGPDGEVLRLNPAAENLFSDASDDRNHSVAERLEGFQMRTPEGRTIHPKEGPAQRALKGEATYGTVLSMQRIDGKTIWISTSAAPIRNSGGDIMGVVVTFTDITPLRELQAELEITLHTISHDLRSPLTVVQGHTDLLWKHAAKKEIDGVVSLHLEAIREACIRMNGMIQDLVETARLKGTEIQLRRRPVNLQSFFSEMLSRVRLVLEIDRVKAEFPSDLPPVNADVERLERIWLNLIANALKYSHPGTPVEVEARAEGEQVVISIKDRGYGISLEEMESIFQRFYRAREGRMKEGTGLGLYIAKKLVEAHGGSIGVRNRPKGGSVFFFSLPVAREKSLPEK